MVNVKRLLEMLAALDSEKCGFLVRLDVRVTLGNCKQDVRCMVVGLSCLSKAKAGLMRQSIVPVSGDEVGSPHCRTGIGIHRVSAGMIVPIREINFVGNSLQSLRRTDYGRIQLDQQRR